jgi:hypothetical protein
VTVYAGIREKRSVRAIKQYLMNNYRRLAKKAQGIDELQSIDRQLTTVMFETYNMTLKMCPLR